LKIPKILNEISDIVMDYRPRPKSKRAQKREAERKKAEKEAKRRKTRESSI
jgi:hypothetical protein